MNPFSHLQGNPNELVLAEPKNVQIRMCGGAALPDNDASWSRESSLRSDLLILEQIEAIEDRVASASMQSKVSLRSLHNPENISDKAQEMADRFGLILVNRKLNLNQIELVAQ